MARPLKMEWVGLDTVAFTNNATVLLRQLGFWMYIKLLTTFVLKITSAVCFALTRSRRSCHIKRPSLPVFTCICCWGGANIDPSARSSVSFCQFCSFLISLDGLNIETIKADNLKVYHIQPFQCILLHWAIIHQNCCTNYDERVPRVTYRCPYCTKEGFYDLGVIVSKV